MDFKYISMCRFLPLLLPGPVATSVLLVVVVCLFLLWSHLEIFSESDSFSWGWNLCSRAFLERLGQEEKVTGKRLPLVWQSPILILLLAAVSPLPWTNKGGCGVLFWGLGLLVVVFCVCFSVCVHCAEVAHLIFTFHELAPPWAASQWTGKTREEDRAGGCAPGSCHSCFDCVFPSAALGCSLSSSPCGSGKRVSYIQIILNLK